MGWYFPIYNVYCVFNVSIFETNTFFLPSICFAFIHIIRLSNQYFFSVDVSTYSCLFCVYLAHICWYGEEKTRDLWDTLCSDYPSSRGLGERFILIRAEISDCLDTDHSWHFCEETDVTIEENELTKGTIIARKQDERLTAIYSGESEVRSYILNDLW